MTEAKQPEALRLAEWLVAAVQIYPQRSEDDPGGYASEVDQVMDEAAAELRRLYAENATLQQGYDEYIRAADALAALTTAEAVPLEGWVMVPVELAQRVQESLGEFLMDHGWSQRDMDTSDEFGAVLLAAAPKA